MSRFSFPILDNKDLLPCMRVRRKIPLLTCPLRQAAYSQLVPGSTAGGHAYGKYI